MALGPKRGRESRVGRKCLDKISDPSSFGLVILIGLISYLVPKPSDGWHKSQPNFETITNVIGLNSKMKMLNMCLSNRKRQYSWATLLICWIRREMCPCKQNKDNLCPNQLESAFCFT